MIDAVIERCAGFDVGKKFILVCTLCGPSNEVPQIEIRTYGTTTHALQTLEPWLYKLGCRHVVMESTGDYWKPIFNIREERMTVVLVSRIRSNFIFIDFSDDAAGGGDPEKRLRVLVVDPDVVVDRPDQIANTPEGSAGDSFPGDFCNQRSI